MKSKSLGIVLLFAASGLLGSCASGPMVSVKTDYNHRTQFGQYHTYALDLGDTILRSTGRATLEEALQSSMTARGFRPATTANADLLVVPSAFTQEKADVIPTGNVTYYPSRRGYRMGSWEMNDDVRQYVEGTLVLDFVDRRKREVVFRGVAQGVVSNPERNAAGIRNAVERIVADLPAPASR